VPEPASGKNDSGWGDFFAKKLPSGSAGAAASPATEINDNSETKDDVNGNVNGGDIQSDVSSGDDDIDIIIRDSDSVAEGVSQLHLSKALDQGEEKTSLSGWDAAPTHVKKVEKEVGQLGRGYILAKTRRRITDDGGRSILATDQ